MPRIDLPPELYGSDCIICEAMGRRVTARLIDSIGGPVCYDHFAIALNLDARERWEKAVRACKAERVPLYFRDTIAKSRAIYTNEEERR